MIDDEFTRLDAITRLLYMMEGKDPRRVSERGLIWCTRCDYIWGLCPCVNNTEDERIYLSPYDAVKTLGRVLGG